MDPFFKHFRSLEEGLARAWESVADGWRDLIGRSSGALTYFTSAPESRKDAPQFPRWGMLAAETWETAHSIIIRVELPGIAKEDLNVSIDGNTLRIRGHKREESEHEGRFYHLTERAYGKFERNVHLPRDIDSERAEIAYENGVLRVILLKKEPVPPRQLNIP